TVLPSHGDSVQADIGDRERLHENAGRILRLNDYVSCRSDQRRAKWQDAVAVARRAFGKKDDWVASHQTFCDLGVDLLGLLSALAVDKDRLLQLCQQAKDRPISDLPFGDKH